MQDSGRPNRKRGAPQSEDCNECAALTPSTGAPSTCIKISFQGHIRRFRIPLPISIEILRKICRHCYGIAGNVRLAYQKQTDGEITPFGSSEELLRALVDDKKVSDRGELLIATCLRIVVTDQEAKKKKASGEVLNSSEEGGLGKPVDDDEFAGQRTVSIDSVGSSSASHRDFLGCDSDNFGFLDGSAYDRTLDFMFGNNDDIFQHGEGLDFGTVEDGEFPFMDLMDPVQLAALDGPNTFFDDDEKRSSSSGSGGGGVGGGGGGGGGGESGAHGVSSAPTGFPTTDLTTHMRQLDLPREADDFGGASEGDSQKAAAAAAQPTRQPVVKKENPLVDVELLKSLTIYQASDDAPVAMSSIMSGRAVLLHVIRRYGCGICREHARELSLLKPALDNYGVKMLAVGRGKTGLNKWKKGGYWHGDLCYESDAADVSKALSLTKTGNAWGLFEPKVLGAVLKTGVGDLSKDEGDYWNLAGTFVFTPTGELAYEMRQKTFADTPSIEELMTACRRAAGH